MRRFHLRFGPRTVLPLSIAGILTACGGGAGAPSDGPNADAPADSPPAAAEDTASGTSGPPSLDAESSALVGGGLAGAEIDGWLDVHVTTTDAAPIAHATVMLRFRDGRTELGLTRDHGSLRFQPPALRGPVDVHVFAEGFEYQSWIGVDRQSLTVVLRAQHPPTKDTAITERTGQVTGWSAIESDGLGALGSGAIFAYGSARFETPNAGPQAHRPISVLGNDIDLPVNTVVERLAETYTLRFHPATTLGLFGTFGRLDLADRQFTPTHLALLEGPDVETTDIDLASAHPLTERTLVEVEGADADDELTVTASIELANGGILPAISGGRYPSGGLELRAPAALGPLEDHQLRVAALRKPAMANGRALVFRSVPPETPRVTLAGFLPIPSRHLDPDQPRTLRFDGLDDAHLTELTWSRGSGARLWRAYQVGEGALVLPVPPAGLSDPLSSTDMSLRVRAMRAGTAPDPLRPDDVLTNLVALSEADWSRTP